MCDVCATWDSTSLFLSRLQWDEENKRAGTKGGTKDYTQTGPESSMAIRISLALFPQVEGKKYQKPFSIFTFCRLEKQKWKGIHL